MGGSPGETFWDAGEKKRYMVNMAGALVRQGLEA